MILGVDLLSDFGGISAVDMIVLVEELDVADVEEFDELVDEVAVVEELVEDMPALCQGTRHKNLEK